MLIETEHLVIEISEIKAIAFESGWIIDDSGNEPDKPGITARIILARNSAIVPESEGREIVKKWKEWIAQCETEHQEWKRTRKAIACANPLPSSTTERTK